MNCRACQGDNPEIIKRIRLFDMDTELLKCRACGFTFVGFPSSFESLEEYYTNSYYSHFPLRDKDTIITRIFKKILFRIKFYVSSVRARSQIKYMVKRSIIDSSRDSKKSILDVGCGNGALLAMFRKMGWQVYGLEPNRYFANEARKLLKLDNIFEDTLEKHNFSIQKFDLITICHILEHSIEPNVMLQKAKSLLKKDGLIFIEVRSIHDTSRGLFEFMPIDEIYFYSQDTLRKMLECNALRTVSIDAADTLELTIYDIFDALKRNSRNLEPVKFLINLFYLFRLLIVTIMAYFLKFDPAKYHKTGENISIRALVTI